MPVDGKSVNPTSAVQRRFRPEVDSKDIIRLFKLTYCSNKNSYVTNGTGIRLLLGRLQAGNGRIQAMPRLSSCDGRVPAGHIVSFMHICIAKVAQGNQAVDTVESEVVFA